MNASEFLRKIMRDRNLKQMDIIRLCQPLFSKYGTKIERNDLSQYVSGKVVPEKNKALLLADALNVSPLYLSEWCDHMDLSEADDRNEGSNTVSVFSNRLLRAMHERDISAAELSRATGISKSRISRYLSAKYEPKADALGRIAEVLNVNLVWLSGKFDERAADSVRKELGDLKELMFERTLRAREAFRNALKKWGEWDSLTTEAHARFSELYTLIEYAGLEDEYHSWRAGR